MTNRRLADTKFFPPRATFRLRRFTAASVPRADNRCARRNL
jgi:hypothetical protein